MTSWKRLGFVLLIVGVLSAQPVVEDPVMKIRSQRATSGGDDLPPVPRGILEPPPLPAPEVNVKDTPGWHVSRSARKGGRKIGKVAKGRPAASPVKKVLKKKKKH
jgi:hypothetical protein